jgi:Tfp pilus assembly protein PilE
MSLPRLYELSHSNLDNFRLALNKQQKLKQATLIEYILLYKSQQHATALGDYLLEKLYPGKADLRNIHKLAHDTFKSFSEYQYKQSYNQRIHQKPHKTDEQDWPSFAQQYFKSAVNAHKATAPAILDTIQLLEEELAKSDAETRYTDYVQIVPILSQYRSFRNALEQARLAFDCLILSKFDTTAVPQVDAPGTVNKQVILQYWARLYQLLEKPSLAALEQVQYELLHNTGKIPPLDRIELYNKALGIYVLMSNKQAAYRAPRAKAYREAMLQDLFQPHDMMSRLNAYVTALQAKDEDGMAKMKQKLKQRHAAKSPIIVIVQALEHFYNKQLGRAETALKGLKSSHNWAVCYRSALLLILYWEKEDLYHAQHLHKAFNQYFKRINQADLPVFERSFQRFNECFQIMLDHKRTQRPIPFTMLDRYIQEHRPAFSDFFKQFNPL